MALSVSAGVECWSWCSAVVVVLSVRVSVALVLLSVGAGVDVDVVSAVHRGTYRCRWRSGTCLNGVHSTTHNSILPGTWYTASCRCHSSSDPTSRPLLVLVLLLVMVQFVVTRAVGGDLAHASTAYHFITYYSSMHLLSGIMPVLCRYYSSSEPIFRPPLNYQRRCWS